MKPERIFENKKPRLQYTLENDEGEEIVFDLPAEIVKCENCRGKGSHVNRAIDGNGISQEDFDEDPDFREAYMRGDYDVACDICGGEKTVWEIDRDACKADAERQNLARVDAWEEAEARYWAACRAERRMGA